MGGAGRPARAAHAHSIAAEVGERQRGEVGDDVGIEVARRIVHLVEQLLAHGVEGDHAAGLRRLRDDRRAIGLALSDRERDAQRVGVGPPRPRVVAARDLPAALEKVADDDTGGETVPVVPGPLVLVHERREEQRRVGDPTGDDDVRAGIERFDDRPSTEIGVGEQRVAGKPEVGGAGPNVVAHDGRDEQARSHLPP